MGNNRRASSSSIITPEVNMGNNRRASSSKTARERKEKELATRAIKGKQLAGVVKRQPTRAGSKKKPTLNTPVGNITPEVQPVVVNNNNMRASSSKTARQPTRAGRFLKKKTGNIPQRTGSANLQGTGSGNPRKRITPVVNDNSRKKQRPTRPTPQRNINTGLEILDPPRRFTTFYNPTSSADGVRKRITPVVNDNSRKKQRPTPPINIYTGLEILDPPRRFRTSSAE